MLTDTHTHTHTTTQTHTHRLQDVSIRHTQQKKKTAEPKPQTHRGRRPGITMSTASQAVSHSGTENSHRLLETRLQNGIHAGVLLPN